MQQTKLFALLKSLQATEQLRLKKYLRSPIVNEEPLFARIYEHILPKLKASRLDEVSRESIGVKFFPAKRMNNQDYARLLSNFSRKVEQFLIFEKNRKSKPNQLITLLEILNERDLGKYFPDLFKYIQRAQKQKPLYDSDYYLQQFKMDAQQNLFLEIQQQRTNDKNLQQTLQSLDAFYIINKLRYCAAMLHYKSFLSMQGEVPLLSEVLAYLDNNEFKQVPLIGMYRQIILCFTQPEKEEHYDELIAQIVRHEKGISNIIIKDIYSFAMVYCISMINFGKTEYQQKLFQLYKNALPLGIMEKNGEISPWDYKNIVTVALRTGNNKWALAFIQQYRKQLNAEQRENAYTFNLARYYFFEKKFDKVLPLLQNVKYNDIFYQLDSKTTLMKTYYELGEYLPLMALKESFRILLRRKKLINEQNRINYMNLIRFTMKLYRVDVKDKKKLTELKKQITNTTNIADKGWLMEKVLELEG